MGRDARSSFFCLALVQKVLDIALRKLSFVLEQQNKVRFMRLESWGKPDGKADISGCGGDGNGVEVSG